MIKNCLLFSTIILFYACSSKNLDSFKNELNEANVCQTLKTIEKKLNCYRQIVKENSYSQLRLGIYNTKKYNAKEAFSLLTKSYENNNPYANTALAYLYHTGIGVDKNISKSVELLKEVEYKDLNGTYRLAMFYLKGGLEIKDIKKGIKLLNFVANKELKLAQVELFKIYSKGLYNIKKDKQKAIYWENKIKNNKNNNIFKVYEL